MIHIDATFDHSDQEVLLTVTVCPYCDGYYAVDSTWLDQTDNAPWIACPMCDMQQLLTDEVPVYYVGEFTAP
jgi:hypothetical protein